MTDKLLELEPLRILPSEHDIKHAVLKELNKISLIRFAAHGDAVRGEICLAPIRYANKISDDFIQTMGDVSWSSCELSWWYFGKIKAKRVFGITRTFLGYGTRSVLASVWSVDAKAILQFMKQFHDHLVRGKSASESLHETMKWMRRSTEKRHCQVGRRAPFIQIGDHPTLTVEE